MTDDDFLTLNGERHVKQARYARDKKVSERTIARHRGKGLPYIPWAGAIYIPEVAGDEYIRARIKRRNPPRAAANKRRRTVSNTAA